MQISGRKRTFQKEETVNAKALRWERTLGVWKGLCGCNVMREKESDKKIMVRILVILRAIGSH